MSREILPWLLSNDLNRPTAKRLRDLGQGAGSVGKVLVCKHKDLSPSPGPVFKSQAQWHAWVCEPSTKEAETGQSWDLLAAHPSLTDTLQDIERPRLKQMVDGALGKYPYLRMIHVLYMQVHTNPLPCVPAHIWTHTDTHIHIHQNQKDWGD